MNSGERTRVHHSFLQTSTQKEGLRMRKNRKVKEPKSKHWNIKFSILVTR